MATVDGRAITQRDFSGELAEHGTRASDARLPAREVVERLIDRALLVRVAEREKLHLTPEFLTAERRGHDDALIAILRRSLDDRIAVPDDATVDRYIAAHPTMFAERHQLVLDQLLPAAALTGPVTGTADDVAAAMTRSGVAFQRSTVVIDSGALGDSEARRLIDAPLGQVQQFADAGGVRLIAVVTRASVPITGNVARDVARLVMRRALEDQAIDHLVAQERQQATIRYRPDVSPARQ